MKNIIKIKWQIAKETWFLLRLHCYLTSWNPMICMFSFCAPQVRSVFKWSTLAFILIGPSILQHLGLQIDFQMLSIILIHKQITMQYPKTLTWFLIKQVKNNRDFECWRIMGTWSSHLNSNKMQWRRNVNCDPGTSKGQCLQVF